MNMTRHHAILWVLVTVTIALAVEETSIAPLTEAVMAGRPVVWRATAANDAALSWDFGDGQQANGPRVSHTFRHPGIHRVTLRAADREVDFALVRVHTADTLRIPQVVLDTDQKNEQDDQHYFAYALFSELDVLAANSVHHGGGQEPTNYAELVHVLELARQSGLPEARVPPLFHGANRRLSVPGSGNWQDTEPIITPAARAILAAAKGAAPDNPVWVVPVGPGTNVASALLMARAARLDLRDRMRVMWLGGSNGGILPEFNGRNDPWSMYVVCHSGIETWVMPAPVGARVAIDKRTEGDLYPDHPLGRYLKRIVPARRKPLFDPSCLAAIISLRLDLDWVRKTEWVRVAGPKEGYRWRADDAPTNVRVIRDIDAAAMKCDLFETIGARPSALH